MSTLVNTYHHGHGEMERTFCYRFEIYNQCGRVRQQENPKTRSCEFWLKLNAFGTCPRNGRSCDKFVKAHKTLVANVDGTPCFCKSN